MELEVEPVETKERRTIPIENLELKPFQFPAEEDTFKPQMPSVDDVLPEDQTRPRSVSA